MEMGNGRRHLRVTYVASDGVRKGEVCEGDGLSNVDIEYEA